MNRPLEKPYDPAAREEVIEIAAAIATRLEIAGKPVGLIDAIRMAEAALKVRDEALYRHARDKLK